MAEREIILEELLEALEALWRTVADIEEHLYEYQGRAPTLEAPTLERNLDDPLRRTSDE
jgi:hypothetical protein